MAPSERRIVRDSLKAAIRFPPAAYSIFKQTQTMEFLIRYKELITNNTTVPPFIKSIINLLDFRTALGSVTDFFKMSNNNKK
jgi:hypothetical protein